MRKLAGAIALAALPFVSGCAQGKYSIADIQRLLDQRGIDHFTLSSGGEYFNGTYNSKAKLIDLRGTKTRITHMGPVFGDDGYDYFARLGESAEVAKGVSQIHRDEYMNILQDLGRKLNYRLWFIFP